jgi:hypothetical protein
LVRNENILISQKEKRDRMSDQKNAIWDETTNLFKIFIQNFRHHDSGLNRK